MLGSPGSGRDALGYGGAATRGMLRAARWTRCGEGAGEDMRGDDCAVPVGVESLTLILGVSGHR